MPQSPPKPIHQLEDQRILALLQRMRDEDIAPEDLLYYIRPQWQLISSAPRNRYILLGCYFEPGYDRLAHSGLYVYDPLQDSWLTHDGISFHAATGQDPVVWLEVPADYMALGEPPQRRMTADFLQAAMLNAGPQAWRSIETHLRDAKIFDEASYLKYEWKLSKPLRAKLAAARFQAAEQAHDAAGKKKDPYLFVAAGPPWLQNLDLCSLKLPGRMRISLMQIATTSLHQVTAETRDRLLQETHCGEISLSGFYLVLKAAFDAYIPQPERIPPALPAHKAS